MELGWDGSLGIGPKVFRNLSLSDPPYLERLLRDAKKDVTIALRFWERHLNRLCRMHELREKEPGRLPLF